MPDSTLIFASDADIKVALKSGGIAIDTSGSDETNMISDALESSFKIEFVVADDGASFLTAVSKLGFSNPSFANKATPMVTFCNKGGANSV